MAIRSVGGGQSNIPIIPSEEQVGAASLDKQTGLDSQKPADNFSRGGLPDPKAKLRHMAAITSPGVQRGRGSFGQQELRQLKSQVVAMANSLSSADAERAQVFSATLNEMAESLAGVIA